MKSQACCSNQSASKSLYPEPDSLQINQLNSKFLFVGGSLRDAEAQHMHPGERQGFPGGRAPQRAWALMAPPAQAGVCPFLFANGRHSSSQHLFFIGEKAHPHPQEKERYRCAGSKKCCRRRENQQWLCVLSSSPACEFTLRALWCFSNLCAKIAYRAHSSVAGATAATTTNHPTREPISNTSASH